MAVANRFDVNGMTSEQDLTATELLPTCWELLSILVSDVVLLFRPECSLVKVDHGFMSGC